jgi:hypothetical protein
LLGALPAPVLTQQPDRVPVQRDQPPTGGRLRRSDGDLAAVGDALLFNHRDPGVQVDVRPAQPGGLTAAQAAKRDQPPHHREPVLRDER